jgi:DNA repair protein RadC
VLGQRIVGEGSLNEVPAYPRLVVETALNYNANSILLCHNHPGGVALPSAEDIRVTRTLYTVLSQLSVRLVDHIIITGSTAYSMTEHNDILGVRDSAVGGRKGRVREEPQDAWQNERTWEE